MPGQNCCRYDTHYLVNGGDVISLQGKLAHSSLTMTDRYVHLASDQAAIIQERVAPMDKLDVKPMRVPRSK
jgi:site-specific recombinase XerD